VRDLARAHVAALEHLERGGASTTLNLGTGTGFSVLDIIRGVEEVTGRPVPRRIAPRRAGDPPVLVADAARAKTLLGWEARCSTLPEMIASAWSWLNRN